MDTRFFGVEEATRLVPFLKEVFEKVRPLAEHLAEVLQAMDERGPRNELVEARAETLTALEAHLKPVEDLGIEVRSADGLVDFPALRHGRRVYLCWRFPEDEVTSWHELDSGFRGRQPVTEEDGFEASYLA